MSEPQKIRCRFGLNLGLPIFKNAGIFVIYMTPSSANRMAGAVETIRAVLTISGRDDVAKMVVFEQGG